jgi:hypothetical protein
MSAAPSFLNDDNRSQTAEDEVFRAAPANRRSEALAWVLGLGFAVVALVGLWRGEGLTRFSAELAAFFGAIGLWISFGNWIDRRTAVEVSGAGIRYRSPLRNIALDWQDVDELWALPSGSSWRIVVRGRDVRFGFRTSSELRVGKRFVQIGFPEGERLAGLIRGLSGLSGPVGSNDGWVCTRPSGVSE